MLVDLKYGWYYLVDIKLAGIAEEASPEVFHREKPDINKLVVPPYKPFRDNLQAYIYKSSRAQ